MELTWSSETSTETETGLNGFMSSINRSELICWQTLPWWPHNKDGGQEQKKRQISWSSFVSKMQRWNILSWSKWPTTNLESAACVCNYFLQWPPRTSPIWLFISFDCTDWWLLTWLIYWDEVNLTLQHMDTDDLITIEALQLFDKSPSNQVRLHHGGPLEKSCAQTAW